MRTAVPVGAPDHLGARPEELHQSANAWMPRASICNPEHHIKRQIVLTETKGRALKRLFRIE